MARITHEIKQTEPSKDELEAYYVAPRTGAGTLRKISVIEQMYGYYTAG